jgi:hypothetical protein
MCLKIGDFSSLFELSASLVLATGILQEIISKQVGGVRDAYDQLLERRVAIEGRDSLTDAVDEFISERSGAIVARLSEADRILLAMRIGLVLGVAIPVMFLYVGGANPDDCSPASLVNLGLIVSGVWGPGWFFSFWLYARRRIRPLHSEITEIRKSLIGIPVATATNPEREFDNLA